MPTKFDSLTRAGKVRVVIAWWLSALTRNPILTAGAGAKEAAEYFGVPFNTIRGLQNAAFPTVKPWNEGVAAFDAQGVNWEVYGVAYVPPAPKPLPEAAPVLNARKRVAANAQDVVPRRKATGRNPGYATTNSYTVLQGVFRARVAGEAIHTCKRCNETSAFDHGELVARFGLRTVNKGTAIEKLSFQAYCRRCKTAARRVEREAQLMAECAELERLETSGDEAAYLAYALTLADKDDARRASARKATKAFNERAKGSVEVKTNADKRRRTKDIT